MKLVFTTKLSIEDCKRKLAENAEKDTISARFSTLYDFEKNFFYKIHGNTFRLEKVIHYRNSFKPIFYGTFIAQNNGTKIEGHFDILLFVKVFMSIWFIGAIFGSIGLFLATLRSLIQGTTYITQYNTLIGLVFPFLFVGAGIGIVVWGKHEGRKNEQQTIEFIRKTLVASLE